MWPPTSNLTGATCFCLINILLYTFWNLKVETYSTVPDTALRVGQEPL